MVLLQGGGMLLVLWDEPLELGIGPEPGRVPLDLGNGEEKLFCQIASEHGNIVGVWTLEPTAKIQAVRLVWIE